MDSPITIFFYDVSVDCVITAISQEPDLAFLSNEAALKRTKWNTIAVDNVTLQTDQAGVFAGGDAVTGPNTVIDAIAAGHVAARSIDQYLEGVPLTPESHSQPEEFEVAMDRAQQAKKPRNKMPLIPPEQRKRFEEVESGFNEALAITEAQRCLRCGPCSECIVCVPECQKAVTVLSLPDSRNDFMLRFPGKEMQIESSAAGITLDDGRFIPLNAMDCYVNTERCLGCGECVAACLYHAPRLTLKGRDIFVSNIDPVLCKNCGTCVAVCPSSAINQNYFTDAWLERMLQPVQKGNDPIVLYFCNWAHTADLIPRIHELETNCLAIKVNCTGRIEPSFVLQAFERGATGVFVVGCPRKSCHFTFGNDFAEKQFNKTKNMLNLLGFPADNFNWFWYEEDKSDKILSAIDLMKQSRDQNTENSTGSKVPLPDYLTS